MTNDTAVNRDIVLSEVPPRPPTAARAVSFTTCDGATRTVDES